MPSGTILVVDDSPTERSLLLAALEPAGFRVLAAHDGEEALETARREHPDLVLLDVILPRRNGFQVCRELKSAAETRDIKVLATSRQPLHVPGEEVLRLGPLPVPGTGSHPLVLGAGDAVELFAQRAAAAVSGFRLTEQDLPDVIRLCRRLDGIPLAIELAAVRIRALTVAELAARVEAGLEVGTGTRRGTVGCGPRPHQGGTATAAGARKTRVSRGISST